MAFDVAAYAYDRFMGRYSTLLSPQLADLAGVRAGQRVLDVGCGPGALTAELVRRLDHAAVAAVDPSEPFVAAARMRNPGVDVRQASAEQLPFPDRTFDAALAQLVVHFMSDPVAGLAEMARVRFIVDVGVELASRFPEIEKTVLSAELEHPTFDEWWEPLQLAGAREGHLGELLFCSECASFEARARSRRAMRRARESRGH